MRSFIVALLLTLSGVVIPSAEAQQVEYIRFRVSEYKAVPGFTWDSLNSITTKGWVNGTLNGLSRHFVDTHYVIQPKKTFSKLIPYGFDHLDSLVVNRREQALGWASRTGLPGGCLIQRELPRGPTFCVRTFPVPLRFVAMNDDLVATGYFSMPGEETSRVFVYDNLEIIELVPPSGIAHFFPRGVDPDGDVYGIGEVEEGGYKIISWRQDTGWRDVGFTPHPSFVDYYENASGTGYITVGSNDAYSTYFISQGFITEIPSLPPLQPAQSNFTVASGLSDAGEVVGISNGRPFYSYAGTTRELKSLLLYRDRRDYGLKGDIYPVISANGLIAAVSTRSRSGRPNPLLLLTPIKMGDMNKNGRIFHDKADLRKFNHCMKQYRARGLINTVCEAGDFNGDGVLNGVDETVIKTLTGL